jgi:error-prone DNA polymerase
VQFVEFHAQSAFSFLEASSHPEDLAEVAFKKGLPAIALLDNNGIYGAARLHFAAQKHGIKAHIGAGLNISDEPDIASPVLPLIATTQKGYQNLCQLITTTKLRAAKNTPTAATFGELRAHAEGLICLTGDEKGVLAAALASGGTESGRKALEQLISIFGHSNVYIELQRHLDFAEDKRNLAAVTLARELSLPLLATNGVRYARSQDRQLLDVLLCVKHKRTLHNAGQLLCRNSERYIKSAKEMSALFADLPEAIENSIELSSRITFALQDLGYEFPSYPVPRGETMMSVLRRRSYEGAQGRYGTITEEVKQLLEKELEIIGQLRFEGYFLIVTDVIDFCRQYQILAQGRGSAANSITCFALKITCADPIQHKLLFERFLSPERGEWPDIDIDLPSGKDREKVIQYVLNKYGERGAAMTANVICYRGRSTAREVGKVLGFGAESLEKLSAAVSSWEFKDTSDTLERQFGDAGLDLHHPKIALFYNLYSRIRNLPRHLGQHSGGVVIFDGRLDSIVPIEPATMLNRRVVQFDKDDGADLKILKVDLLGLRALAAVRQSIDLIQEHYGIKVDPAKLPYGDDAEDIYKALQKGDTIGLFQIESPAQISALIRNHPTCFNDVAANVALVRPGPNTSHMTARYLRRRMGLEPITYPHECVSDILEPTYGVPIYQEQVMRIAVRVAGLNMGQADRLRRALSSPERMEALIPTLRSGMAENGIKGKKQDELLEIIIAFRNYTFPQSHAISFGQIAWTTAFLQVRFRPAYTAAILNERPGFYPPDVLIQDAQRHGVRVKYADITKSKWTCSLEWDKDDFSVRIGLCYVSGLREEVGKAIYEERLRAPFASIQDLQNRVGIMRQDEFEALAGSGALNNVGGAKIHRRDALWQVAAFMRKSGDLFRHTEEEHDLCPLPPMTKIQRVIADYQHTGLTTGPDPMFYCRPSLHKQGVLRASDIRKHPDGKHIKFAGNVIARQRPGDAHGVIFLRMKDESGIIDVIVYPDLYDQDRFLVLKSPFLLVHGTLQNQHGVAQIRADKLERFEGMEIETVSRDFR